MNNYPTVRLGDVCEIVMGTSPEGNTISQNASDGIEFHQGKTCFGDLYLNESGMFTNAPVRFADAGNVIMSVRAPVGDSNITPRKIAIGRGLCTFNTKSNFEKLFLYYYLNSQIDFLKSKSTGSTFKAVNKDVISDLKIPLPPLSEQKHIAAVLDKCTELIAKYKQMLEKYDTLIKSRFIEMFEGNKYPRIAISEMVEGKAPSAKKLFNKSDEIKYIDISSVDNKINEIVSYTEYIFENAPSRAQQYIRKNDILISTVRPNLKNIAINKLEYKETVASSGFCVLRPKYVPEYLFIAVLQDKFTSDMVAVTTGANYPAIKDSDILNYEISNPPLELQQQFATFVQQIDKSKFEIANSLKRLYNIGMLS
jgi:type I restriction enzyme S subunit